MGPLVQLFAKYSELVYVLFFAKAAGLILNIIKLGGALKNLAVATGIFNAALWTSPITWIIAGIVALTAGIVALVYHWKDLTNWFQKMIDKYPSLKRMFDGIKMWAKVVIWPLKKLYEIIVAIVDAAKWVANLFSTPELTVEQKESANNWMADQGLIERPKYSPAYSSSLQMSPLADSQIQIATAGGIRQSADINVRFDNTPPMTRIDTVSRDTNLDLEIYRGANGGTIQ